MVSNRLRRIPTLLPRILSRQYATPLNHLPQTQHKITVQGPHVKSERAASHHQSLLSQLRNIPKDASDLAITEDTPSDTEWDILGSHFTAVRDLEMFSGFNEDLNDRKMPNHWPIERLSLADSCGEVTKSPHILQGRIKHLILNHTSELRFEGPASAELRRAYSEAVKRGERTPEYSDAPHGKIEVIDMSQLAGEWLANKYKNAENHGGGNLSPGPENRPVEGQPSRLRTLEIIENDALCTFVLFGAALPHVVDGLTSMTLRSTEIPRDLGWFPDGVFLQLLSVLGNLQTLNLSVGEIFKDPTTLPSLYKHLPLNLTTLQFRGPLSFGRSNGFNEWIDAFGSETFLPKLERLAFVLDYHYGKNQEGQPKKLNTPPEKDLAEARAACERLYEVATRRGIKVQPLHDPWVNSNGPMRMRAVDSRW
ncbi:hypothetical protein BDV06DRAFT_227320 [Aspergillus oleicola]